MAAWLPLLDTPSAAKAGMRFGTVGAHTSRTIMLGELRALLAALPAREGRQAGAEAQGNLFAPAVAQAPLFAAPLPTRADYARAVVDDNVLGKDTASSRRTTLQRLSELYGLDPQLAIFRVLRRLWELEPQGRPLLALLCALARDPLLRASAVAVLPLAIGAELSRATLLEALAGADATAGVAAAPTESPARFNAAILDKIARNTASSWAQAGHLEGRVRKLRRRVQATPATAAFALWLGAQQELGVDELLRTLWAHAVDATPEELFELALAAKQRGLLRAVSGGGVRVIEVTSLDPAMEGR